MPTNTRRLSLQTEFSTRPQNPPTATPDDVFGGQKWWGLLGGGFSKIFDPRYRLSPRPLAEVFEFLGPPCPDSLPNSPGGTRLQPSHAPLDSAGASSSRARRTGTEQRKRFLFPHVDHPENSPPGSDRVLRNPVFFWKTGFLQSAPRCRRNPVSRKILGFTTTSDGAREWSNPFRHISTPRPRRLLSAPAQNGSTAGASASLRASWKLRPSGVRSDRKRLAELIPGLFLT
jgi:hypothetical protein